MCWVRRCWGLSCTLFYFPLMPHLLPPTPRVDRITPIVQMFLTGVKCLASGHTAAKCPPGAYIPFLTSNPGLSLYGTCSRWKCHMQTPTYRHPHTPLTWVRPPSSHSKGHWTFFVIKPLTLLAVLDSVSCCNKANWTFYFCQCFRI